MQRISRSPQARHIGHHLIIPQDPDLLRIVLIGNVSPQEGAEILFADREHVARTGYSLSLLDATLVGRVPPETRKRAAEIMKDSDGYLGCCAVFGTSAQIRILFSLINNAVSLFLKDPAKMQFFKTESEGLYWLNECRPWLSSRAARRG